MRPIRALTTAAVLAATLPLVAGAQGGRQFKDAWFWGVKAGGLTYADGGGKYQLAPMGGAEWLITRTHGGLYVSLSQAFMTTTTRFPAGPTAQDSIVIGGVTQHTRVVDLQNLRKLDMALMAFPGEHLRLHPYAGLGFSMADVPSASGRAPYTTSEQLAFTNAAIRDLKVGFTPLLMLGTQVRTPIFSVFAQGELSPAQKNFLLYNGKPVFFAFSGGVRYNVGSSVER
jgi:hypothetical protein